MTTTPSETSSAPDPGQHPHHDPGPRVGWDDIRDLGRIRRTSDRRVAGVAGGLGRHLDIDPVIVRVAFVVLTFFAGVGLLLYIGCWLLLPEEGRDRGQIALDRRSRVVALVGVGVLALLILLGHGWWGAGVPWVLVVGAVVVFLALQLPQRGKARAAAEAAPAATEAVSPATEETVRTPVDPPYSSYSPEFAQSYATAPRPANPRRRGPILFWFTMAVAAVAEGVLGIADLAGASVVSSAYPALLLAICGVALLVGAFFGRAGGLILVGLLAWALTVGATVADRWDVHRTVATPLTAAAVESSYRIDVGELVVDLAQVSDPKSLDGRVVHVDGDVGHLDIRVPPRVNVIAHLDIDGPGGISAFGEDVGGLGHHLNTRYDARPGAPTLTIDATLDVGAIDLHTEEAR